MDDNTALILSALAQGAARAALDVVPDAYAGLRELLRKRLAGQPTAELVLHEHAKDPAPHAAALAHQLKIAALVDDPEVLALTHELLVQLGSTLSPTIEIGRGAKGIIGQTVSGATIVGDIH
jgi:hypothetical protein